MRSLRFDVLWLLMLRCQDARDLQFRFFREHVGLLSGCLVTYVGLSRLVQRATNNVSVEAEKHH